MKDLRDAKWEVKTYTVPVGLCKIDLQGSGIRRMFELIIEVYPTTQGVDGDGHRASGSACATVISARPEPVVKYPVVLLGEIICTPFGNYQVEYYRRYGNLNTDWLALTEVK